MKRIYYTMLAFLLGITATSAKETIDAIYVWMPGESMYSDVFELTGNTTMNIVPTSVVFLKNGKEELTIPFVDGMKITFGSMDDIKIPDAVETVKDEVVPPNAINEYYSINGVRTNNAINNGITIVRKADGSVIKVLGK